MKTTILIEKEVEIKTLHVFARVRYWEDATVNGQEDTEGSLIPFKDGDTWKPVIDIDSGKVINWPQGTTADIHYKVCDAGIYELRDAEGNTLFSKDGYVPDIMCPEGDGFGDYIIMKINTDGQIENWKPDIEDLREEED